LEERASVKLIGKYNSHWRPQHELCRPCDIDYDYIGRFENIQNDAKYLLSQITASDGIKLNVWNFRFPLLNAFQRKAALSIQRRNSFYDSVPYETMAELVRMYKLDYQLFGYDYSWTYHNDSNASR